MTAAPHDPGGRSRSPMPAGVTGHAIFAGPNNCYRPLLIRDWAARGGYALWVGLNPSTADGETDDPTVKHEVAHTRRLWPELAGYRKMNVADYRATDRDALRQVTVPLCSPGMLDTMKHAAVNAAHIVLAYGQEPMVLSQLVVDAMAVLRSAGRPLWCLGRNKDGSPRHPLYLRKDTPIEAWS